MDKVIPTVISNCVECPYSMMGPGYPHCKLFLARFGGGVFEDFKIQAFFIPTWCPLDEYRPERKDS